MSVSLYELSIDPEKIEQEKYDSTLEFEYIVGRNGDFYVVPIVNVINLSSIEAWISEDMAAGAA